MKYIYVLFTGQNKSPSRETFWYYSKGRCSLCCRMNSVSQRFVGRNCKASVSENVTAFCVCLAYCHWLIRFGLNLIRLTNIANRHSLLVKYLCRDPGRSQIYRRQECRPESIAALPTPHSHLLTCTVLRKCFPIVLPRHFVYFLFQLTIVLLCHHLSVHSLKIQQPEWLHFETISKS